MVPSQLNIFAQTSKEMILHAEYQNLSSIMKSLRVKKKSCWMLEIKTIITNNVLCYQIKSPFTLTYIQ